MKKVITYLFLFPAIAILAISCSKDVPLPKNIDAPVFDINFNIPNGWPQPVYGFQNNTPTEAGFKLGRKLFYDKRLSRDNTISCGSCHQQFAAFAHSAHALSHGIDGLFGTRNAPGLFNLAWHPNFMWDGGVNHIEVQPLAPITNPVEMDETIGNVVLKLSADQYYPQMFMDAFGTSSISSQLIFKAITQFQGLMISSNSKYDNMMRGELSFNSQEQAGLNTFRQKCASCHTEPLFSDFSFRNNGLPINQSLNDSGRAHITGSPSDRYKFKVPSLRNIMLTSPYMHDGRFQTIDQCLEHYNSGISQTQNLDPLLTTGITLTQQEKADIITFFQTLTDNTFTNDIRFKEPR